MAEHRDESGQGQAGKSAQSKKPTQSSGAAEPGAASERTSATVVRRKQRYLIGFRSLPGIMPAPADPFLEKVSQTEGVEIIRRLPMSGSPQARAETMVVRMDEQRGEALRLNAPPHVIVELDAPLDYSDMIVPEPISDRLAVQAIPFTRPRRELLFRVVGEGDRPIANAVINLYGPGFFGPAIPAQAITDSSGQATLAIHSADAADMRAIHVRPAADHWERYIQNPSLELGEVNVI